MRPETRLASSPAPRVRAASRASRRYGIEYSLSGRSMMGAIGEWSLDKRHYGSSYPPRNLQTLPGAPLPPSPKWLLDAFNEATAGIPTWPDTKALGTVGWRRVKGEGISSSPLASKVVGTRWSWSGIDALEFKAAGELVTPWGSGGWGALPHDEKSDKQGFCGAEGCLFADFSGALHNVRFDWSAEPNSFKTFRVGDGESITGLRL